MSDYRIEAATKEEWAERALKAEARVKELEAALRAAEAERDRAMKSCEALIKRFTPSRLRYAPKDRIVIGVERPPFEETTFFYEVMWDEDRGHFMIPRINAYNGATHFLDPRDLIGLPPQERLSREDRKKANARAALEGEKT